MTDEAQQPVFSIEKLYVKDLSLEVPSAPQCFLERDPPQIDVQLQTTGTAVGDAIFDVVLTVTVSAKIGEKTQFLVEAAQAGLFQIRNVPEAELEPVIAVACPNILFPFVREVISDAVSRAGFPPVLLAPVNFENVYRQRLMAEQERQAQGGSEVPIQ
ncbi:MAG: protein-export chaperone SecB [Rhodocyclales bacterium GWA2_65_20]|nr:MAG: protein-export chaperone SecB [Rhodocyclales bacterium GWA2_65_20]